MNKNRLVVFSVLGMLIEFDAEGMQHQYPSFGSSFSGSGVSFGMVSPRPDSPQNMSVDDIAYTIFNSLDPAIQKAIYRGLRSQILSKYGNKDLIQQIRQLQAQINELNSICQNLQSENQMLSNQLSCTKAEIMELKRPKHQLKDAREVQQEEAREVQSAPVRLNSPILERPSLKYYTNIRTQVQGILNSTRRSEAKEKVLQFLLRNGAVVETQEIKKTLNRDIIYSAKLNNGKFITPVTPRMPCVWEDFGMDVDTFNEVSFDMPASY